MQTVPTVPLAPPTFHEWYAWRPVWVEVIPSTHPAADAVIRAIPDGPTRELRFLCSVLRARTLTGAWEYRQYIRPETYDEYSARQW